MIKNVIKFDEGYWKMIQDSIFIFKLITNSNDDDTCVNYYKKVSNQITKHILHKSDHLDKQIMYPVSWEKTVIPDLLCFLYLKEQQKEILQGTETLIKLLFFNESDNIQRHIRISVFDAIMHWTDFLLVDVSIYV